MKTGQKSLVYSEIINSNFIQVWADEDMKEVIKNVPGVTNVYNSTTETQFDVFIDKRFDVNIVRANIECMIMINGLNEFKSSLTILEKALEELRKAWDDLRGKSS